MMPRLSVLLFFATVLAISPAFSQNKDEAQDAGPAAEPLLLLSLADGDGSSWNPSWPADFPPDAFSTRNADARSIELVAEAAEKSAEGAASVVLARWDGRGRLLEFPFAIGGAFVQVAVRRSATGRVNGFVVASASELAPKEAGNGAGGGSTTMVFKFAADGSLQSVTTEGEAGSTFAAFVFRGARGAAESPAGVTETRTGEDGLVTAVLDYAFVGDRIISIGNRAEAGERITILDLDYDSAGHLVAMAGGDYQAEALYDGDGRVAFWRVAGAAVEGSGAAVERRFQWDERGFLVRESIAGAASELRYEYTTDGRGNWVERRSTRWVERFGALVSEDGPRLRRIIRYR